jgi:hypothetical protein
MKDDREGSRRRDNSVFIKPQAWQHPRKKTRSPQKTKTTTLP